MLNSVASPSRKRFCLQRRLETTTHVVACKNGFLLVDVFVLFVCFTFTDIDKALEGGGGVPVSHIPLFILKISHIPRIDKANIPQI